METVREYVNLGLSIRAKEHQKVRQPLASVTVPRLGEFVDFEDILIDELNVKKVIVGGDLALNLTITPELKQEGLMREVIRYVQAARKSAGLNVDDRIKLSLVTVSDELKSAIVKHQREICDETLATILTDEKYGYLETNKVDGGELTVSLEKA
jgi:isoleucyl-tRNA synthetase